jgi:hypothetical protein
MPSVVLVGVSQCIEIADLVAPGGSNEYREAFTVCNTQVCPHIAWAGCAASDLLNDGACSTKTSWSTLLAPLGDLSNWYLSNFMDVESRHNNVHWRRNDLCICSEEKPSVDQKKTPQDLLVDSSWKKRRIEAFL